MRDPAARGPARPRPRRRRRLLVRAAGRAASSRARPGSCARTRTAGPSRSSRRVSTPTRTSPALASNGFAGCNDYAALARASGRTLLISQVTSTQKACGDVEMTFESTFLTRAPRQPLLRGPLRRAHDLRRRAARRSSSSTPRRRTRCSGPGSWTRTPTPRVAGGPDQRDRADRRVRRSRTSAARAAATRTTASTGPTARSSRSAGSRRRAARATTTS